MRSITNLFRTYKTLFVCLFLYVFIQCLTLLDNNHDGIIGNISLTHLMRYMVYSLGLITIIILSTKSKYSFIKNISFSIFVFIFFWLFLEFISFGVNKLKIIDFNSPDNALLFVDSNVENTGRKPFWGDFNQDFGKWRLPNDSLKKNRCDDNSLLEYKTNNFGARDKERSLKNTTNNKRIIFLGDSFIEGVMVNTPNRCSDILEKETHNEHLNFGINGSSPINYYLIYKSLAKKFEHDVVIIGVLPANDFEDYTDGDEVGLIRFPIYRPYWKNTNKGYTLKYSLTSSNQAYSSLSIYNKPPKIFQTKDSIYKSLTFMQKLKGEFMTNSYLFRLVAEIGRKNPTESFNESSIYENFPKDKWATFSFSLKKLIEEAKGKQVIILTIPTLKDVQLFQKNHKNTFSKQMEGFCRENQVNYIDLLPSFNSVKNPKELYVECDGHWNEKGEKLAAEILLKNYIYRKLIAF
jgi:hypothetical protein